MSELLPQSISEAALLDLAVTCRVLTRDIVTAAFGVSYDAASRCLERLSRPATPYLARLRRRPRGAGRRTAVWYTLRPAGLERLLTLGTDAPADDLRATLRRIERLRWDAVHGPATDLRRIEGTAMLTALAVGASYASNTSGPESFTLVDATPGRERSLNVPIVETRSTLELPRTPLPADPIGNATELEVVPDVQLHFVQRRRETVRHAALLAFIQDGDGTYRRGLMLSAVAQACSLAPKRETRCEIGSSRYPQGSVVRVLVWSPSLVEEQGFVDAARATLGPLLSRVWTTNGEVVPLTASGAKRTRSVVLSTAAQAFLQGAWYSPKDGTVREGLGAVVT